MSPEVIISSSATHVSSPDFSNPLHLHASDTNGAPILTFKLCGTENYNVWSCAMILALETKNKIGCIDGSCIRPTNDDVLLTL